MFVSMSITVMQNELPITLFHTVSSLTDSTHLVDIRDYLQGLERTELYKLGVVLCLSRQGVSELRDRLSQLLCDSIVDYWLQKVDSVVAMHMSPSWRNVVTALKQPRVRQTRLAERIAKERQVSL